ncbi:type I-E CRISPR-associated protein Cse2/CasB [Escherichia coli]
MSIVKDGHKATLRKWHEELQAKRGNRASLRRSTTVNDVCLSEGFRSLLMQTHTLWKIEAQEWRFTCLSAVKTPDDLLRQLRRAVKLLNGSVNLISLADDIFRWCQESDDLLNHHRRQQRPTEFIRIRWALEYYQAGDADNEQN